MPRQNNLEQYLTAPVPLTGELTELSERIAEIHKEIQSISQFGNLSLNAVKGAKNPESHNPVGVMGLYQLWKSLSVGLEEQREKIGDGYEIKLNRPDKYDMSLVVRPENTIHVWAYRLNWLEHAIGCLAFIYREDIKKVIDDQRNLADEMIAKYSL